MTQRVPYLPALFTFGDLVMVVGVGFVKTIIGMKVWCWGWYNNKKKIYRQYISVVVSSHFFILEYGEKKLLLVILYQFRNKNGTLPIRQTKHLCRRLHCHHLLLLGSWGSGRFLSRWGKIETKKNALPDPTRLTREVLEFWIRLKGILHRSVLRTQWKWEPYHPIACVFFMLLLLLLLSLLILIVVHWRCPSILFHDATH